jgi:hypothetical protein
VSFEERKLLFKWSQNFEKILEVPKRFTREYQTKPPASESTSRTPSQHGFCGSCYSGALRCQLSLGADVG